MDFQTLAQEMVFALRGKLSQARLSRKLGHTFNKAHRWESGRTIIGWSDFVAIAQARRSPLSKALRESYSYFGDPTGASELVKHFIGQTKLVSVAKASGISRYTLSRLLNGAYSPSLPHMLNLMSYGSADFFRFLEIVTQNASLPSLREQIKKDRVQLDIFFRYPWLSALLSAIDLQEYRDRPSDSFLAKKAKLPLAEVKRAIRDLADAELLVRKDGHWETALKRAGMRGSFEERKKMAEYVFDLTRNAVDHGYGRPEMRFSWKLFSLNQNQYEKILQKYTELFNEIGAIIDQGQTGADKVYLFASAVVDYDLLPEAED